MARHMPIGAQTGFQRGDAVTWFEAGGLGGGTVREVFASQQRAIGPEGYMLKGEPAYLVERPDGAEVLKRLAELAPA